MPNRRSDAPDDPFVPLLGYLAERMDLRPEHAEFVRSIGAPVALDRSEFLQRAGDVPDAMWFVVRGLLRAYVIEPDGREHILRFAAENWWLGDPENARTGTPTHLFYEAIEPSLVIRICGATTRE